MSYHLHVMSADPELSEWSQRLLEWSEAALNQINQHLPLHGVDIVIYRDPGFIIPELGICGFASTANMAFVSVDPLNENFGKNIEVELPATLAHELHHCMRWSGPGYGNTLREALISEGLAQHFEAQFRGGEPAFYSVVLDASQLSDMREQAMSDLDSTDYSHNDWFFGSESQGIPMHTGYSLGFEIVGNHLEKVGKSAADLWKEPATSFEI